MSRFEKNRGRRVPAGRCQGTKNSLDIFRPVSVFWSFMPECRIFGHRLRNDDFKRKGHLIYFHHKERTVPEILERRLNV